MELLDFQKAIATSMREPVSIIVTKHNVHVLDDNADASVVEEANSIAARCNIPVVVGSPKVG